MYSVLVLLNAISNDLQKRTGKVRKINDKAKLFITLNVVLVSWVIFYGMVESSCV